MAAPANGVACEPERGGARKVNREDAEAAGGVSHLLLLGLLRQVSYHSHGVFNFSGFVVWCRSGIMVRLR